MTRPYNSPAREERRQGFDPRNIPGNTPGRHQGLREDSYTQDEVQFMMAMDRYKREHRRPFPTWYEVFHVFMGLGYHK